MANEAAKFAGLDHEFYDSILGPAMLEGIAADIAARLPHDPPGDLLELACGTGIVTRRLRRRLSDARKLVATDLSPAMTAFSRGRLGNVPGIEWREADAGNLPFPDASFGAVVCSLGIMFVPDKRKAVAEARRMLMRGGRYIFNTWDRLDENPHARIGAEVMEELFPGDAEIQAAKTPFSFHDVGAMRALIGEAGLKELRMEKVSIPIECESAERYATGMVRGTPRSLLIRQRGKSYEEVIERVAEALAREGGKAPFRLTGHVIVFETQAV